MAGEFNFNPNDPMIQRKKDEEKRKQQQQQAVAPLMSAIGTAAQSVEEQDAAKYTQLGAMSPEQQAYIDSLKKQGESATLSPEFASLQAQMKEKSEGRGLQAEVMTRLAQEKAARQQMALAYARGYDPGAARAAMRQMSEQQTDIAGQGMQAAAQEKAAAMNQYQQILAYQKEQQARAQQAYGQMLQYQQQMAFSAEQARKAYLMGNKELAQQYSLETQRIKAGLEGTRMQVEAEREKIDAQKQAAWIGAAATIAGAGISAYKPGVK